MNKMILNTIDDVKEYNFEEARIFTTTYKTTLKPYSIHTPKAAKIILETESKISAFIVLQPLIKVDGNGDIQVFTPSTMEHATLRKKYMESNYDKKDLKSDLKLLKSQLKLGLSIKEMFDMNMNQSLYEASILEKRKEKIDKGGGF